MAIIVGKLKKFLVMGGEYGSMAHLHILAPSAQQALTEYHRAFGDRVKGWDAPSITDIEARPDMERFWVAHGNAHFSEGY